MYRRIAPTLIISALCGCSSSGTLTLNGDGVSFDRAPDTPEFANASERLACQMDYRCDRPLTRLQERRRREQEREKASSAAESARQHSPLPPISPLRDARRDKDRESRTRRSLMFEDEAPPALPDPFKR